MWLKGKLKIFIQSTTELEKLFIGELLLLLAQAFFLFSIRTSDISLLIQILITTSFL